MAVTKTNKRLKIKARIRSKVSGTSSTPRLTVFRSNSEIYAQMINDIDSKTVVSASTKDLKDFKGTKLEASKAVGLALAKKAVAAGITSTVFDRNGYLYHGRVKALADGAREGGLQF